MRVWVDGSAFENDRQHGVWRVFYEIMSRTAQDIDYTLWLRAAPKRPLPSGVKIYRDNGRAEISRYNLPSRWARRNSVRQDPPELGQAVLFHSTGFTFPHNDQIRSINTVYDMIAESHFPMCVRELQESIAIKRKSLQRATSLACISESTAHELASFYPNLGKKSIVVALGAEHLLADLDSTKPPSTTQSSSALFVGQRLGYKNFFNLLHAMNEPTWPSDVGLDVVGPPWLDAEQLLIDQLKLNHRIRHLGTLSDDQLQSVYRTARCLIFPSFQEGFGLPCLEAQANDCPLLCSDIPVFHEVAGDAAWFFDPRLGGSIAEAVNRLDDPKLRYDLIERGRVNVRRFSWQQTASKMIDVYERALSVEPAYL